MIKMTPMAALLALAALGGCQPKQENGVGPAQQAGKAVDDAGAQVVKTLHAPIDKAHDVQRQVEEQGARTREQIEAATDDARLGLNKATEEVGKKVEKAGEKIQEAAK
jgi:outer membrane murein-binding lipoprotein Lpp